MRIYLVRHAEKIPQIGDPGLTDLGFQQASKLGNYFIDKKINKIVSSNLRRAIETAETIVSFLGLNYSIDERLAERLNFGEISNQTYREYVNLVIKSSQERSFLLPNNKSSISKGKEIENFIIESYRSNLNMILVSHGGAISDFLRNNFDEKLLAKMSPLYFSRLEVGYASITEIILDKNGFKLISLNKNI